MFCAVIGSRPDREDRGNDTPLIWEILASPRESREAPKVVNPSCPLSLSAVLSIPAADHVRGIAQDA